MESFIIDFKGKKRCDTLKEALEFKERIGDRYLRTYQCKYPDAEFYIVEFKEVSQLLFQAENVNDDGWDIIIQTLAEHLPGFHVSYGNGNWVTFEFERR